MVKKKSHAEKKEKVKSRAVAKRKANNAVKQKTKPAIKQKMKLRKNKTSKTLGKKIQNKEVNNMAENMEDEPLADKPSHAHFEKMKFTTSGIKGFDDVLGGGYPHAKLIMLSGRCGTGKTTFGMQYLYHGAKKENENGVFVALEKEPSEIIESVSVFDDLKQLVNAKKISIVKPDMHRFDTFKKALEEEVVRIGAKRLVIDSFSFISAYFHEDPYEVRRSIAELSRLVKRLNCTTIVIEDILEGSPFLSYTGYKEFVVGGVIVLDLVKKDPSTFARTVFIRKMTGVNHSLKLIPIEITGEGIVVYPDAEVF